MVSSVNYRLDGLGPLRREMTRLASLALQTFQPRLRLTFCRQSASTMHEAITLNVWPSTINCLSWSQDGNIAVAAGETVELLVNSPTFND